MTLTAGTKLGPYEIQSPLGASGMGEVHRARDTRLAREVAIKVLPEAFARNAASKGRSCDPTRGRSHVAQARFLRTAGMPVIHVHVGFRPGCPELSSRSKLGAEIKASKQHQEFFQGKSGATTRRFGQSLKTSSWSNIV